MTVQTFAEIAETLTTEILSNDKALIVALIMAEDKSEFIGIFNTSTQEQKNTLNNHIQSLADSSFIVSQAGRKAGASYDKTVFETDEVQTAIATLKDNKTIAINSQKIFGAKMVGNFKKTYQAINLIDKLSN